MKHSDEGWYHITDIEFPKNHSMNVAINTTHNYIYPPTITDSKIFKGLIHTYIYIYIFIIMLIHLPNWNVMLLYLRDHIKQ